ncbi:hypothetical protein ACEWA6_24530, partial [Vibrio parahaemolyticus]
THRLDHVDRATAVAAAPARAGSRRRGRARRDLLAAAAFLLPTIVLIVLLRIWPTIGAVVNATRSGLPGSLAEPEFVGLELFG